MGWAGLEEGKPRLALDFPNTGFDRLEALDRRTGIGAGLTRVTRPARRRSEDFRAARERLLYSSERGSCGRSVGGRAASPREPRIPGLPFLPFPSALLTGSEALF